MSVFKSCLLTAVGVFARRAVRAGVLILVLSLAGAATACEFDLWPRTLEHWDDLPSFRTTGLSDEFLSVLRQNPRVDAAARTYRDGADLCFNFSRLDSGSGGWGIQGEFARRLLRAMFPAAIPCSRARGGRVMFTPTLFDSALRQKAGLSGIDMMNLKAANPGPAVPSLARVRELLNLPANRRIASVYSSWTHSYFATGAVADILRTRAADVVIWSTQDHSWPGPRQLTQLQNEGVAVITSDGWEELVDRPSQRVLILNLTAGRMPFVHAAADVVAVLGMANGFEAVAAGRPTFVTRRTTAGYDQAAWDAVLADLGRAGGVRAVESASELTELLKDLASPAPRAPLYRDPPVLDRLVGQIVGVIDARVERHRRRAAKRARVFDPTASM